jgi:glutamyl-Q tRNA(Asp) synthetase
MRYRGRFAPSPTGVLHFGSLIAAVASFVDARAAGGDWLVRIEDLDRPREVPGASAAILNTLKAFGLHWDGEPLYQHRCTAHYERVLTQLGERGLTYPCACSRAEVERTGQRGPAGIIYSGTCRHGLPPGRTPRALRLRTPSGEVCFTDRIQGAQCQDVTAALGDPILCRADGIHAYQLAVVVDDARQGVTHVVRGADLLASTPVQCLLQQLLGLPAPAYAHVPLALDAGGRKLSKSLAAAPVDPGDPLPALQRVWAWLGQPPAPVGTSLDGFWSHACAHWRIERVPAITSACVEAVQ